MTDCQSGKSRRLCTAILFGFIAASNSSLNAQPQTAMVNLDRSKEVSAEALKTCQAGDPQKAIEIAAAQLEKCALGAIGSECRGLLNYTIGYIYQRAALIADTASDREHALGSAATSYRAALNDDPSNGTIHFNLALVLSNSGDQSSAITELQRAVQADPQQWQYSVRLGDIQVQLEKWHDAMEAYTQATSAAPAAEAPAQRIIALTRRGHGLNSVELQSRCNEWELLHPSIAASCYEQLITMLHAADKPESESVLVAWLRVIASQEKIDEHLLDGLPQNWNSEALPPMRAALHGETLGVTNNWWTESDERREAWARFLLAIGQSSTDPRKMEMFWQAGLSTVRSDYRSASGLELRRALALLYVRRPDLDDPVHTKLNGLVQQLFSGKMGAIESDDLEAEQRYHIALGLIFARQQKWGSSDNDVNGAMYQLRRTVEVAELRYQRDGIYQPLPEIKELRVKVFEQLHRPYDAQRARWDAAQAYMDSDQLGRAAVAIEAIHDPGAFDKATLNFVLGLRREANVASDAEKGPLIAKLSNLVPSPGISRGFLERQQFKALADLVTSGSVGTREASSIRAAIAAFSLTMERHVPLIGVNDLSRWQAVQGTLVKSVGGRLEELQASHGASGTAPLKLTLPETTVPENVEVSVETIQAGHVAQILGPEVLVQYGPAMTLSRHKLAAPRAAVSSPTVRQELESNGLKLAAVPQ